MKSIQIILIALTISFIASDLVFLNDDAKKTCPKYSCDSGLDKGVCAKADGKFSDGSRTVKVKVCEEKKYCPLVADEFKNDGDKKDDCKDVTVDEVKAYPGEACTEDKNCRDVTWYDDKDAMQSKGACDTSAKTCKGSVADKKCQTNESCVAGYYCKDSKCVAQVDKDGACESTFDCKNNLICSSKKCADALSFDVGAALKDVDAMGRAVACKTTLYDATAKEPVCLEERYKLADGQTNSSGIVKCDVGSKCKYERFDSTKSDAKSVSSSEQECACPLNGEGQGYCPYSQNEADGTLAKINSLKGQLNNKNHTVNRFSGNKDSKEAKCAPISGNILFKNAPQCVIDALGYTGCSSAIKAALSFFALAIMFVLF